VAVLNLYFTYIMSNLLIYRFILVFSSSVDLFLLSLISQSIVSFVPDVTFQGFYHTLPPYPDNSQGSGWPWYTMCSSGQFHP